MLYLKNMNEHHLDVYTEKDVFDKFAKEKEMKISYGTDWQSKAIKQQNNLND